MNDEEYIKIALLAEGTIEQTSPNPVVGANEAVTLKIKSVQKPGDDLKVIAIPDIQLTCKSCEMCPNNGINCSSS